MEQLPKQEWTPRPIGLPEEAAADARTPSPIELEFADKAKEVLGLIDDIDGLFGRIDAQLDAHLSRMSITPDPADDALAKALERFESPGKIDKQVLDRATLVVSVPPNGLLPVEATTEPGPPMFISASSQGVFDSCAAYAQNIKDFMLTGLGLGTGNDNMGISGVSGQNRKIQDISRKKALLMIFYGIMRSLIDMISGVLKPFKWTPVGFVIGKIMSWLRKKLREGERKLTKADPIGRFAHSSDSSERYEVWTKLKKITWVGPVPKFSYEYEMWCDDENKPYQKITDVPRAKIVEYLTKPDPDPSSPKTNITQSRLGWTSAIGDYLQSISVVPISVIPPIPAMRMEKYADVVQFIVVDTDTYFMDQNDWVVKPIPTQLDPDLQPAVSECTANAMAILSAADTYHLYNDSSSSDYPNQSYMVYRTIGSVKEGYQATKAVTQSMLTAGYEALNVAGLEGVADKAKDYINDAGDYVNRKVTGPAKRQLEGLMKEYREFVEGLPSSDFAGTKDSIIPLTVRIDFVRLFLVDLKSALQILATELENWLNDRTIVCCFVRDLQKSGRKWRPLIKVLRLMVMVLKNRARQQIEAFLNTIMDLGYLIYNTAINVIFSVLETLMDAGLNALKNYLTDKLHLDKAMELRTKKWECLPLKAFELSLLAGIDLAGDDLLQYLKDMLAIQRDSVIRLQQVSDQSKQSDWLNHLDKLLAALDNMMSYEVNCVNGVAVGPSLPISDVNAGIGLTDDAGNLAMAAQLAALKSINSIDTSKSDGTTMPIDQLIGFYRSYMHYTPEQIAFAFTSDAGADQVQSMMRYMPQETTEMMGVETCLQKLSTSERAEAEARIQQLQQLSSGGA